MKRFSSMLYVILITAALIGILWPLLRPGFYISDDGEWMVIRLSAFYQSLADGQFPVRFLGRLNNSFGYPVANFLYPGFLYLGSILHFIGFSFVTSVKLVLVGAIAGSAIWTFISLRRTVSSFSATIGTLAFIGSPYLLYDLYTRGSVGEIFAFLPGSVGIYSIVANKRWLFPIAVAGLILSHNTLAVLFSLVFLVFILIQRRGYFLWYFFIGIGMAAFFWIPAIAEKRYVRFDTVTVSKPMDYILNVSSMWMVGLAGMLASAFLLITRGKKLEWVTRTALALYITSAIAAFPSSGFIWSIRPIAAIIQFPYRMLAVGTLMTPWLVAAAGERLRKQKILTILILLLLLAIPSWHQFQKIIFVHRDKGYYTTNEGTTTVADEYMPRWVSLVPGSRASERLVFQEGRGTIVYEYLNTQRVVATVDALEKSILRLHTIYYPGWGIMIDGRPVPVDYRNPHGFMEISVPAGTHKIEAEFRETIFRFLADLISVGSLITWGVILWKGLRNQ